MENSVHIAINFISSNNDEERVMDSSSDNIKSTSYNDANAVVDEIFESLCSRYQGNLENQWEGVILFLIQFKICIKNVMK